MQVSSQPSTSESVEEQSTSEQSTSVSVEEQSTSGGDEDPQNGVDSFVEDFNFLGFDLNEIQEWLDIDSHDPGYEHLDTQGIVAHV